MVSLHIAIIIVVIIITIIITIYTIITIIMIIIFITGKIACMVYALVGIPFTLIFLSALVQVNLFLPLSSAEKLLSSLPSSILGPVGCQAKLNNIYKKEIKSRTG